MIEVDRYWQAKKVTLIGATVNVFLAVIKLIGGIVYHSHALVADGVHSLSDLITDVMVLFASKYGSQSADLSHPYGHQRIETAATLLLSLFLVLAGAGLAWDAIDVLFRGADHKPDWLSLPIALFSVAANELLFHYTKHTGKKIKSALLIANAWHHRSDAASSMVVSLGLAASLLGFVYFDTLAALIVGLLIIKMGIGYGWNSVTELVDTAVDTNTLGQIKNIIEHTDGVKKIHQLRSRLMGGNILIDVHIQVAPTISVSEGHFIAQHVQQDLIKKIEGLSDVTVHVDPEDDEIACPSVNLPRRRQLELDLFQPWQAAVPGIEDVVLHYIDGRLQIDLISQPLTKKTRLQLNALVEEALIRVPEISLVRVLEL